MEIDLKVSLYIWRIVPETMTFDTETSSKISFVAE